MYASAWAYNPTRAVKVKANQRKKKREASFGVSIVSTENRFSFFVPRWEHILLRTIIRLV